MKYKILTFALVVLGALLPVASRASDAVALTITPPFFDLNVSPGDSWSSAIKVVNTNPGNLSVYATVDGFRSSDDEGHGRFIGLPALAGDRDALANWITSPAGPITIPSGGTGEIPFSIAVPADATPGGHYAGILVGVGPAATGAQGSHVGVSSFISSLIFVRVSGDVTEQGSISEFSTDKEYYENPDVVFTLKLQNSGNVHLRPMGQIEIYNAWGKERGTIDLNQTGDLGYVLPSSTRKFSAEWKGTPSLFDIGPYTAVVTLAYGENGSKSVSQTVSFWILPIWKLLAVILGTLFFLAIFVIAIRRYVRRALSIEMSKYSAPPPKPPRLNIRALREPVAEGVIDLRKAYESAVIGEKGFNWRRYFSYLRKYALAVVLLLLVLLGILWMSLYIRELLAGSRSFEIKINRPDQATPWIQGTPGT